jgi:hypothetical protein
MLSVQEGEWGAEAGGLRAAFPSWPGCMQTEAAHSSPSHLQTTRCPWCSTSMWA